MSKESKSGGLFGFFRKGEESSENHESLSEEAIRKWLINRLAKHLKVDPSVIDTAKKFEQYGLDSIVAVRVSGDLEKLVEQRLSPAMLFEHPSIDEVSAHLAKELELNAYA